MYTFNNPKTVHTPLGGYSHAARLDVDQGTLLWISGQVALNRDHLLVGPGDVAEQTRQVFENLAAILTAHGATFENVVNIRSYLVDMDKVGEYGGVRREFLKGQAPSSTTVGVTRLVVPDALVEVDLAAMIIGRT